jgi:hypothetical protein
VVVILFTPFEEIILDWALPLTALFCSGYQVIDYHIWTTLVSLTVIYFGFDSMNLKHITSNLVLFILLPQNDIIL